MFNQVYTQVYTKRIKDEDDHFQKQQNTGCTDSQGVCVSRQCETRSNHGKIMKVPAQQGLQPDSV
ncbi:hypothetical protein, partial [Endozoicomonas sp. ONNA1]|uniref:hypothetical protein n=1 Tax=unclassified Endozoicomonas TaxID=2644528 RepID=UPI0034D1AB94